MIENSKSTGLGICGTLFLIFLTLKLTGLVDWSWWIVIAPLWIGPALLIAFCIILFLLMIILR